MTVVNLKGFSLSYSTFFSYHFETFVCFLGDHKTHFLLIKKNLLAFCNLDLKIWPT